MASSVDKEELELKEKEAQEIAEEVVSVELPAPKGWKKKFTPKKGGTPRRNEIVFISPTGEEVKNKRQLDQFLKAHPGGPSSSEFDWGTGDTPRRSARISEKVKATETPEGETPKKRERKSSSKKSTKDKKDLLDGEDVAPKEEEANDTGAEKTPKEEEATDTAAEKDPKEEEATGTAAEKAPKGEEPTDTTAEKVGVTTDVEMSEAHNEGDKKTEELNSMEKVPVQSSKDTKEETITKENSMKAKNPEEATDKMGSHEQEVQTENNASSPVVLENKDSDEASNKKKVENVAADEASPKKDLNVGELSGSTGHKDRQEESRPRDTHASNCEETRQPKAPPVSC